MPRLQASERNHSQEPPDIRRPVALLATNIPPQGGLSKSPKREGRNLGQESTNSVFFDKPRTGDCLRLFKECLQFRGRCRIERTIRAKCFCALPASCFRTSATFRRAFTGSPLQ